MWKNKTNQSSHQSCLTGISMFSLCLWGFSPGSTASFTDQEHACEVNGEPSIVHRCMWMDGLLEIV